MMNSDKLKNDELHEDDLMNVSGGFAKANNAVQNSVDAYAQVKNGTKQTKNQNKNKNKGAGGNNPLGDLFDTDEKTRVKG